MAHPNEEMIFSVEIHDVLANDDHGVVLAHATADREDKRLDQDIVYVMNIRDGKVSEFWIHNVDQASTDRFWS
jgi:ketosteroid isomerase-like protein